MSEETKPNSIAFNELIPAHKPDPYREFERTIDKTRVPVERRIEMFDEILQTRHRLDTDEALAISRDEASIPMDGDTDMADIQARMGRTLLAADLIRLLKSINPNLIFDLSTQDPSKFGIYIMQYKPTAAGTLELTKTFLCGMESGPSPEFSILIPKFTTLPTPDGTGRKVRKFAREWRGWRTVLARLYMKGLLTEPDIERVFKISHPTAASSNWQQLTQPRIHIQGD